MANYANLEAAIQAAIYENNTNDITGAALQTVLLQMVSDMGKSGMLCNGVCDGNTVPPVAPDSNIFYIAPTGTYANFGGLTVADGEWAIFIYNGGWQKQSIPVVTADAVPTTGSTNPVQSGGVADALDTKADIDGYYSTLTAGSAENLIGRGTVPAKYTRRTSGGSADIGSGAAAIEKIHGNTIAWNQLIQNGNFATATGWTISGGTLSISGGIATCTMPAASGVIQSNLYQLQSYIGGHIYLIQIVARENNGNMIAILPTGVGGEGVWGTAATDNTTNWTKYVYRWTAPATTANRPCQCRFLNSTDTTRAIDGQVKAFTVTDLTLAFGSGNEPTASEFSALFPLNYYDYNTGSLVSLTGTGIETNGFNQWDEVWEVGAINASGGNSYSTIQIRSTNYIAAFPSTTYFIGSQQKPLTTWGVFFYDATKTFISSNSYTQTTFTTPANCYYMRFCSATAYYGTTYLNDICINLSWSGYRNGEYEAYWDSTLALPITTVTSGGSAVFADGMKSGIGNGGAVAYDELTATKAVVRMEKVDLGSLSWSYSPSGWFWASLSPAAQANGGVICSKYAPCGDNGQGIYQNTADKVIGVTLTYINTPSRVYVRDTSAGTDAAAFKTAMNGVYLYYELATPTEYTLDNEVNLNYRVDDFGTETLLPQNNATPTTAPIIYDVRYAMNAVDTLRNLPKNYISKDSMEHILNAMVTAGVISAYTLTWNATNENYDCTITA